MQLIDSNSTLHLVSWQSAEHDDNQQVWIFLNVSLKSSMFSAVLTLDMLYMEDKKPSKTYFAHFQLLTNTK